MPLRTLLLAVGVSLALLAGALALPAHAGAARANLWVDRDGGSCRRSAPHSYLDGRACGGLHAAYGAAVDGDTILVRGGTYGRQVLPGGQKRLLIVRAPGARPIFGTTTVRASNITLAGFTIRRNDNADTAATLEAFGNHNRFLRIRVNTLNRPGRQGIAASGDWNLFKNGSSANVVNEKAALVGGSHVTFLHFKFHDVVATNEGIHNECVYSVGPHLTVKRSHFWNCATMDLFITRGDYWTPPQAPYGGVTIENNVFEHPRMEDGHGWHYYGLLFGGQLNFDGALLDDLKVRYNTFETAVSLNSTFRAGGNSEWIGNVGGGWDCIPGMVYRFNVGEKCSATDVRVSRAYSCGPPGCATVRTATQGWVNPARHNFHLKRGAPAIGRGNPNDFPLVDLDGRRRPMGAHPDAGAFEYRPY